MATRPYRPPSRSYEPLAIRICKAANAIPEDRRPQWVSVTKISQFIKVKDEEMLNSAITLAAQKGWLMVGGQPVHSVIREGLDGSGQKEWPLQYPKVEDGSW